METLEQLMTTRHEAYIAAKATYFERDVDTWRNANQAYAAARDAQRRANEGSGIGKATRKSGRLAA